MGHFILVINPGGSSTKLALFEDERVIFSENLRHHGEELKKFSTSVEQLDFREKIIRDFLREKAVRIETLSAVVGRGGPFKPLESGTYIVNEAMLSDILEGRTQADHPSNLGALLADRLARNVGIPAYIVDPVSVDEFEPIARVSGLPELPRVSLSHALNIKMIGKRFAKEHGKDYNKLNLIIVHLGSGISVTAHKNGRMIDVNNANDEGPFSPQRTGTLPLSGLIRLCYSGKYTLNEMLNRVHKTGGLYAYLGTDNVEEVEKRIAQGDKEAEFYLTAMAYQIAKEIGAYAAVLYGRVDAILVTGGAAHSGFLVDAIKERVSFIAPVFVYPGEDEMLALALGALRVLNGEEKPKEYKQEE